MGDSRVVASQGRRRMIGWQGQMPDTGFPACTGGLVLSLDEVRAIFPTGLPNLPERVTRALSPWQQFWLLTFIGWAKLEIYHRNQIRALAKMIRTEGVRRQRQIRKKLDHGPAAAVATAEYQKSIGNMQFCSLICGHGIVERPAPGPEALRERAERDRDVQFPDLDQMLAVLGPYGSGRLPRADHARILASRGLYRLFTECWLLSDEDAQERVGLIENTCFGGRSPSPSVAAQACRIAAKQFGRASGVVSRAKIHHKILQTAPISSYHKNPTLP
jgi:hypothetical protein